MRLQLPPTGSYSPASWHSNFKRHVRALCLNALILVLVVFYSKGKRKKRLDNGNSLQRMGTPMLPSSTASTGSLRLWLVNSYISISGFKLRRKESTRLRTTRLGSSSQRFESLERNGQSEYRDFSQPLSSRKRVFAFP